MISEKEILEKWGAKRLHTSNNNYLYQLIHHPFYENEPNFFVNEEWTVVQLLNDFFIEAINFEIIRQLSTTPSFILCSPHESATIPQFTTPLTIPVEQVRTALEANYHWTSDWYLLSETGNWAGIVVYDSDAVYLGYASNPNIDQLIQKNPNFKQFLKQSQPSMEEENIISENVDHMQPDSSISSKNNQLSDT